MGGSAYRHAQRQALDSKSHLFTVIVKVIKQEVRVSVAERIIIKCLVCESTNSAKICAD